MNQFDEAILYLEKAREINENDEFTLNNLGSCYCRNGKEEKGLMLFDKCLEINKTYAEAYHNKGLFYMWKKQLDKAIEFFEKGIELKYVQSNFEKASCLI